MKHQAFDEASFLEAVRGHTPDLSLSKSAPRRAAVAIILCRTDSEGLRILFIQRAEDPRDYWSGHMAFPGGGVERGDRNLEETARRETREEVGLILRRDELLGRLDDIRVAREGRALLSISPFVYLIEGESPLALSPEVARAFWLPVDVVLARENIRAYCPPNSDHRLYPSIPCEGGAIWGLTYRMLCHLGKLAGCGLVGEEEFRSDYKISPGS